MATRPLTRAAALSLLLGLACGRGDEGESATTGTSTSTGGDIGAATDMFDRACHEIFSCWCVDYGYADEASCAAELLERAMSDHAQVVSADQAFDWGCYERTLEVNRLGCDPDPNILGSGFFMECPSCQISFGDGQLGEPCQGTFSGSTCAQGLRCSHHEAGFCYDPCAPPQVDQPCPDPGCGEGMVCFDGACRPLIGRLGDYCAYFGVTCGPGLICDWSGDEDSTCAPVLAPGESCLGTGDRCPEDYHCPGPAYVCALRPDIGEPCVSAPCRSGAYCDTVTQVCQRAPGIGEPCDDNCPYPTICASLLSVCAAPPEAGEPCVDGKCASGKRCAPGGICQPEPAVCHNP
ncbi:MAG: hypothetical protein KC420_01945 [Myxococcales bacterium]|nr:hypothetical protein [Myxococcales bacterium]